MLFGTHLTVPIWDRIRDLRKEASDAEWNGEITVANRKWDEADRLEREAAKGAQYEVLF